jgi:hypothetical protein
VIFFEKNFPLKNKLSKPVIKGSYFKIDIVNDHVRKSKRNRKAKDFGVDFYTFLLQNKPKTYNEAMTSFEASFLKEDVKDEMDSLISNKTWFFTNFPQSCETIGCKWIFKNKLRIDGYI